MAILGGAAVEEDKTVNEKIEEQFNEVKEKNEKLEESMRFKDKLTGLWSRKYAVKSLSENEIVANGPDFTVVCTDINNLYVVEDEADIDTADMIVKDMAACLQQCFGEKAICCRMAGNKMCVFVTISKDALENAIKELDEFIDYVTESFNDLDISYGWARSEDHPDKEAGAIMKEAEFCLQVHMLNKEKKAETPPPPPEPAKELRSLNDCTVLMIDDSLVMLRSLETMLKENFHILMTTSGVEGFEIAKSKNPDVILLDYNMPVIDGERIMYLLKESILTKHIPVIFISGVSDKDKILKVASLKPAGYLLKPVERDNLLTTINTVLMTYQAEN